MASRPNKAEGRELKDIRPTLRQRIAFKLLSEIIRKPKGRKYITIGKILRQAGYSDQTAKSPWQVTRSKGWLKLMEENFPDMEVATIERQQLHAKTIDHYVFPLTYPDENIHELIESFGFKVMRIMKSGSWKRAYYSSPDNIAVGKSLDRIYRLKRKYPDREGAEPVPIEVKIINYARSG